MNEILREAFRHNAWANRELIAFCRRLSAEQLQATTSGTYGSILSTLNHAVTSDGGYLPKTRVTRPSWAGDESEVGLDELAERVDETAALWERYLDDPLDAEELLILDGGAYETRSSIPVVQALHHGSVHREQVCAILTELGFEAPNLQAWAYAEATGRARELETPRG